MENCSSHIINSFDSLFTTNRIQMLKIIISHLPSRQQGTFAVYIKLMELQYTFSLLQRHPNMQLFDRQSQLSFDFFNGDNEGTLELLEELLPFSSPEERSKIENMRNMMQNMKQMREMMDMIQMMQEMFPEGMGEDGNSSPMNFFAGMSNGDNSSSPMELFSAMSGMMGNVQGMPNIPNVNGMGDLFGMFDNAGSEP